MKKLRLVRTTVLVGLLLCLTGCSLIGLGSPQPEQVHYTFGYTGMDLTDPAYRAAQAELQALVEAKGDQLISFDPSLDNDKQVQGIQDMLDKGIDLLFLAPVDADGVLPALQACREAGVPVVCFDSKVSNADYITTFVGADNYRLGLLIGDEIVRDHPDGGAMGLLVNPLAVSVTDRVRGIRDALEGSGVELVSTLDITRYEQVLPQTEQLMDDHPEINILWGLNDDITLLMHSSVLAAGREDQIRLYGTGSYYQEQASDILVQAVDRGFVRAVSLQSPSQWGLLCGELCYQILDGTVVQDEYLLDTLIVNQENVGAYEADW